MKHKFVSGLAAGLLFGLASGYFGPTLIDHTAKLAQPYAGEEGRSVSSLSASDIKALEAGEGWGLAKPAELNGYPGPLHVLELADQLDLTDEQRTAVEASFAAMRERAKELGEALIAAERALDQAFEDQSISPALLEERLKLASELKAALRATHLSAHLEITPLLSEEQKLKYAELRGYGSGHHGHGGH